MAVNLSPIGGVAAQFFDNNGNPLSGGKIYTYAAGTTTPQTTYTTFSGGTPHANPIILDAAGRVPGGEIWLTDGSQYKFIIKTSTDVQIGSYDNIIGINSNFVNYTNSQEIQTATAGQTVFTLTTMQYQPGTNSLSVFVDGVNQYGPGALYAYQETSSTVVTFTSGLHVGAEVKFTTSAINASSYGDADQISYTPPFVGSTTTNVELKLAQTVSVKDFGAIGDGVANDTAAVQAAVDTVSLTGGCVYFPAGTYLLTGVAGADGIVTGVNVPYTGPGIQGGAKAILLKGDGAESILKANSANMFVVRFSTNNSAMEDLCILGNDTSTGLALVASSSTSSVTSRAIMHNNFSRLLIGGCGENGILLQCPIGTDNGIYYNNFSDIYIFFNQTASGTIGGRGVYFRTVAGALGNQNRNRFSNVTFSRLNTGIEIQDGDTNTFYSCSFEDITKGTYPNATPTAVIVGAGTIGTPHNRFFACTAEVCTRSLLNESAYSEFYGCLLWTGALTLTQKPLVWLGGYDGSAVPTIFPGWSVDANALSVQVNNTQLSAGSTRLFDPVAGKSNSCKISGTFGAISNTATKTLTITFETALATTASATLLVDVTFTGINSSWNATGVKRLVTSGEIITNKLSISGLTDTDLIAAGSLGTAGYITRGTITPSTTTVTVAYVFNAAGAGTSVVNFIAEATLASNSATDTNPFTLSWS